MCEPTVVGDEYDFRNSLKQSKVVFVSGYSSSKKKRTKGPFQEGDLPNEDISMS